jgi:plastocyanin
MRFALAMAIVVLACTVAALGASAATGPTGTGGPTASTAKHRCKKKVRHHPRRKRCRKKGVDGSTTTGPAAGSGLGAPVGVTGRLLATEREISSTELQLQLSRPTVPAGSTIVEQYNAGQDPHNLVIDKGDGSAVFAYPTLDPGGTQRQTLTLTHGTWTLYCSLLNHRELGMQATLTVN